MISLARAMLRHEWRKYLTAVLAVAFSGLLMLVQVGLMLGMFSTVTLIVEGSSADLWVTHPQTQSPDMAREMPARTEWTLRSHPWVEDVQTMSLTYGDWRRPDGGRTMAYVIGFDLGPDSMGLPLGFSRELARSLEVPGAVAVDGSDLPKLAVQLGDQAELNNTAVRVAGTVSGFRSLLGANVFMSQETARRVNMSAYYGLDDFKQFFLVRAAPGADVRRLRDELQNRSRDAEYRVWMPGEFIREVNWFWLTETGSGVGIAFSAVLAVVIGVSITSQTLRGSVQASIREFATLRALGVPMSALRSLVMEQSFWVGVVGCYVSTLMTLLTAWIARSMNVAASFPLWTWLMAFCFMLVVSTASGMLSLRVLYRSEPEELLR